MKSTAILFYTGILFSGISNGNCKFTQVTVDSIFVVWNNATFQSLDEQVRFFDKDLARKTAYENKSVAFKAYLGLRANEYVNRKSIRYLFLKELASNGRRSFSNFYVIEANESGSKVLLRNFVVYIDSTGQSEVDSYLFDRKWTNVEAGRKINFKMQGDLKSFIDVRGFNSDDIIVTKFINGQVMDSQYYLYGTLSRTSGLDSMLLSQHHRK